MNKDSTPLKGLDGLQQSADLSQITSLIKENSKNSPERTSKIFRIKNSGVNNLPTSQKTPERQKSKSHAMRRNS
jgi:hypothetical protein